MAIKILCAWCSQWMGSKPDYADCSQPESVTHSICLTCKEKVLNDAQEYLKQTSQNNEKAFRKEIVK
jgi:hypothetical protein